MERACIVAASVLLVSCDDPRPVPETPEPAAEGLDAREILIRASLDVRGIRPTADELSRLDEDVDALPELLDELSYHPGFGERIGTIYSEALQMRRAVFAFSPQGLEAKDDNRFKLAAQDEAVRLIEFVAAADRPFSEVVTGDAVVVDTMLLDLYPLQALAEQPDGLPEGTVLARYTDGRPGAGIISTIAFTTRHSSTALNAQRGRANAVSRAFLCADYLDRPIDFPSDFSLADSGEVNDITSTQAACSGCHATLDPLASHFWGFMTGDAGRAWIDAYAFVDEQLWEQQTGIAPAYFGAPSSNGVGVLGAAIAKDPRFAACAVRRVYEAFLGRDATLDDEGQLEVHREVFVGAGLSIRALTRSVLDDPAYRGLAARSALGGDPSPVARKIISPEKLGTVLEDLTGFRLTYDDLPALRTDELVRRIAGASEAGASASPTIGHVLVHRRLAEASARALVEGRVGEASRLGALLAAMDRSAAPGASNITLLAREVLSLSSVDDAEVVALASVWDDVASATGDPNEAWTALLTALLADPRMALY